MPDPASEQDPSLTLAIIGGGIAGLLTALSAAHHSPHLTLILYEAASKFGEIGAGVAFGPNAVHALSRISDKVQAGFENVRTGNQSESRRNMYFSFRVGQNGKSEEVRAKGTREGEVVLDCDFQGMCRAWGRGMVHRASFLDEMVKLVPEGVEVVFGKRLVDVRDEGAHVALRFADGSEARHAAVVACDGIKSPTRALLLGKNDSTAHAVYTGKYCYRGLIPMDQAIAAIGEEAAANSTMYHGYHGHMLTFPVQKGKTMNVVAFASSESWDHDEWVIHADREKMYKDFEGWGSAVRKILEMMQKPDIWAIYNHLPAKTYCKGRICLAGDSAHASSPHQGSGAGMAVEDAYVMSMILQNVKKPTDFEAAFNAFDKVRRPRTQKVVSTSRELGQILDFEGEGIKDDVKAMGKDLGQRMDWIWNKDIDTDVEEAVKSFHEDTK